MECIGFLKEQDPNVSNAKHFDQFLLDHENPQEIRKRIIDYLEHGIFLIGAMSYIYDKDRNPIGNLDYFTDGELIWPGYYLYYLKKFNNFWIPEELIAVANKNNFKIAQINEKRLAEVEQFFISKWSKKG